MIVEKYYITSFEKLHEDISNDDIVYENVVLCLDYFIKTADNIKTYEEKSILFEKYISEYTFLNNDIVIDFCSKIKKLDIQHECKYIQHECTYTNPHDILGCKCAQHKCKYSHSTNNFIDSEKMIISKFIGICDNVEKIKIINSLIIPYMKLLSNTCSKIVIFHYNDIFTSEKIEFEEIYKIICHYSREMDHDTINDLKMIFPNAYVKCILDEDDFSEYIDSME